MSENLDTGPRWGRRVLLVVTLVGLVILVGFLASVTVPRWWSHRVGDQVDGSITQGVLVGLFYGFFFTLLPLLVVLLIVRWRRTWKAIGTALVLAIILALPNLMTLGIVLGRGNAAHAGERTLDVDAPAFRGASLAGVLVAVAAALAVAYLLMSRGRAQRSERRARQELAEAKASVTPVQPAEHAQPVDPAEPTASDAPGQAH